MIRKIDGFTACSRATRYRVAVLEVESRMHITRIGQLQAQLDMLKMAWADLPPNASSTDVIRAMQAASASLR
jgi:hypothetical protein